MKKRFSEEQIIGFLREAEAGLPLNALCRRHGFSEASDYLWRSKFGGMEVADAKRLKVRPLFFGYQALGFVPHPNLRGLVGGCALAVGHLGQARVGGVVTCVAHATLAAIIPDFISFHPGLYVVVAGASRWLKGTLAGGRKGCIQAVVIEPVA